MATQKTKAIDSLDPRQIRFVEEYTRTGNALQSALKAGYSDSYAKQISVRIKGTNAGVKSEKVRKSIEEVCEEKGLTPGLLVGYLLEDMAAKKGDRIQEIKHGSDILGLVTKKVQIEDMSLPKLDEKKKSMLAKLMG